MLNLLIARLSGRESWLDHRASFYSLGDKNAPLAHNHQKPANSNQSLSNVSMNCL